MKITGLRIDGFGIWSGLELEGLSEGLNVLFGPNEAGKTTLLQFVRAALYGFSPKRQYLPPIHGGRPGGSVDLAGPSGAFHLERHREENADGHEADRLVLTAADGTRQGEHLVSVLLSNVDETIYNNVFAVGLREIQELGTLSDTDAAELLYSLTAGLDRVSLVEVMRELDASRNRILDRRGGPCRVVELLGQQEKLRQEIEDLEQSTRRYGRLVADKDLLHREIIRLEEEKTAAESHGRVIELAITLRPRWQQRSALDDELAALGTVATVPEGAVERLDALNVRIRKHQRRIEQSQRQRQQLRSEAAGMTINESLLRQSARIEAVGEQESWIAELEGRVGELTAETADLESQLAAAHHQLGLGDQIEPGAIPTVSTRTVAVLRPAAKALRQHRGDLAEAKQAVVDANETALSLSRQIETALATRPQRDLVEAMDQAGNLVSQLRRRLQVDERLDEMSRYQRELEDQSRGLVDRQPLPIWVLAALGGVFVLGVLMAAAGLLTSLGWGMAVLGLAGIAVAVGLKVTLERSGAGQLEACQKQLGMLQMQIQTTKDERESLDGQLPRGGGPLVSRLDAAEKELAALEELLPLDARRTQARQESDAAQLRVVAAEQDLAAARRQWRDMLDQVGLPGSLTPKKVRHLMRRYGQISEMQRRLQYRREELAQRRREFDCLVERIRRIVTETAIPLSSDRPIEQLHRLSEAVTEQESCVARREVLRREARQLRRRRLKHEAALSKFQHLRRELLRESSARDEQEFRQRAIEAARAEVLRGERETITREIATAIGSACPEEAVGQQLRDQNVESLEARWEHLLERIEAIDRQLEQRFERRGQLAEQLKALADDRRLAGKQLDLALAEKRLEDAVRQWQVLAVTSRTLETIRVIYENERQPETLREASAYLDRLTGGRYPRVWTPLGEDVLKVDDAEGNSLPVEVLSRGTREQLFLSLRLALAAAYARRGASLPIVLDDVLVNFDTTRAKAAAMVLRDFAAEGHQLLVFTCHEHVLKLFKSLKVPVSRLPDSAAPSPATVTFAQPPKKKSTKSKKSSPPPEVIEEPEDEILLVEEDPIGEDETEYPTETALDVDSSDENDDDDAEDVSEDASEEYESEEEDYEEEDDYEWEEADEEEDDTAEAA